MVSKNAIKGQRLQLNPGSLLSSWFVWGTIASSILIIKKIKLVVVYKHRGARVNSFYNYVKHRPRGVLINDLLTLAFFLRVVVETC